MQLIINFIDFEKAFGNINRESLWKILRLDWIPSKIVALIKAFFFLFLYFFLRVKSIRYKLSCVFGVKQGCIMPMSSLLFITTVDWVMQSTLNENNTGIRWTRFSNLEDLDYADDLASLTHLEVHTIDFKQKYCKMPARSDWRLTWTKLNLNVLEHFKFLAGITCVKN